MSHEDVASGGERILRLTSRRSRSHSNGSASPRVRNGDLNASLYKTVPCQSFSETGFCRYGLKCRFAHGPADLRPVTRRKKGRGSTSSRAESPQSPSFGSPSAYPPPSSSPILLSPFASSSPKERRDSFESFPYRDSFDFDGRSSPPCDLSPLPHLIPSASPSPVSLRRSASPASLTPIGTPVSKPMSIDVKPFNVFQSLASLHDERSSSPFQDSENSFFSEPRNTNGSFSPTILPDLERPMPPSRERSMGIQARDKEKGMAGLRRDQRNGGSSNSNLVNNYRVPIGAGIVPLESSRSLSVPRVVPMNHYMDPLMPSRSLSLSVGHYPLDHPDEPPSLSIPSSLAFKRQSLFEPDKPPLPVGSPTKPICLSDIMSEMKEDFGTRTGRSKSFDTSENYSWSHSQEEQELASCSSILSHLELHNDSQPLSPSSVEPAHFNQLPPLHPNRVSYYYEDENTDNSPTSTSGSNGPLPPNEKNDKPKYNYNEKIEPKITQSQSPLKVPKNNLEPIKPYSPLGKSSPLYAPRMATKTPSPLKAQSPGHPPRHVHGSRVPEVRSPLIIHTDPQKGGHEGQKPPHLESQKGGPILMHMDPQKGYMDNQKILTHAQKMQMVAPKDSQGGSFSPTSSFSPSSSFSPTSSFSPKGVPPAQTDALTNGEFTHKGPNGQKEALPYSQKPGANHLVNQKATPHDVQKRVQPDFQKVGQNGTQSKAPQVLPSDSQKTANARAVENHKAQNATPINAQQKGQPVHADPHKNGDKQLSALAAPFLSSSGTATTTSTTTSPAAPPTISPAVGTTTTTSTVSSSQSPVLVLKPSPHPNGKKKGHGFSSVTSNGSVPPTATPATSTASTSTATSTASSASTSSSTSATTRPSPPAPASVPPPVSASPSCGSGTAKTTTPSSTTKTATITTTTAPTCPATTTIVTSIVTPSTPSTATALTTIPTTSPQASSSVPTTPTTTTTSSTPTLPMLNSPSCFAHPCMSSFSSFSSAGTTGLAAVRSSPSLSSLPPPFFPKSPTRPVYSVFRRGQGDVGKSKDKFNGRKSM